MSGHVSVSVHRELYCVNTNICGWVEEKGNNVSTFSKRRFIQHINIKFLGLFDPEDEGPSKRRGPPTATQCRTSDTRLSEPHTAHVCRYSSH